MHEGQSRNSGKDRVRTRRRFAAEEGAKAIAQIERGGIVIRNNLERLRAPRLQREAHAALELAR